jgi:class 3 adenylate cyclase/tetratricopeptide (TPR) repeat protein
MSNDSDRLRPFVPGFVSDWLRDFPAERHRGVEGSLAFVDISGFTRLTERLAARGKAGAEEMSDLLDATFGDLLAVAYAYGAWLVKWGGDAVLLLFQDDGHAARACTAAAEMRRTMQRIGALRTSVGPVRLRMSVGVHTGSFDFFLVGSLHRELIITGPAATMTARMEGIAEAGEIVVSPETARLLDVRVLGAAKDDGILLARSPNSSQHDAVSRPRADADLASCLPSLTRDHLLAGSGDGEHRHVAVSFVQFCGVDDYLAGHGAQATAVAVDALIRSAQEAAARHGVTFWETDINTDGGKVMLVAGAPVGHDDDEDRMLATVREIADAAGPLPVRIGVNNGRVFAIEFGPSYRRTYSVKGDAVNLAARLLGKARFGDILATEALLARSRGGFDAEPLEPFMVKGKTHPVRAFRVGAARWVDVAHASADEAPLVGRQAEMAALGQGWESARRSAGRAVAIVGEAGLGKSRLVRDAVAAAGADRCLVVRGDEYHQTTAYAPFRRLLREAMGLGDDADPGDVVTALRRVVEGAAGDLQAWLPLAAAVLGVSVPETPQTAALDEQFRKDRQEHSTVALLRALLAQPTILVFEDAHLMDDASRDLLQRIATQIGSTPWLVVVSTRDASMAPAEAERLDLTPLNSNESLQAIAAMTEEAPLPPHVSAALVERANGNPLFLVELVQAVRESGGTIELPGSIEAIVTAQIDALASPDRTLLRAAAVLGASADLDVLAAVLAADGGRVDDAAVQRLTRFVDVEEGSVRFRHALVRETAYEGLPFSRRRTLHERAATLLEQQAGPRAEDIGDVLSLHYFNAQRYEPAFRYARAAAQQAQALSAPAEAAELYQRALNSVRHLPDADRKSASVWIGLGEARFRLGDLAGASAAYRSARKGLATDPVQLAGMQFKVAQVTDRMGLHDQALRWLSRARRLLEASDGEAAARLRADIAAQYALVRHFQGREHDAVRWCHRAIDEAQRCGNRHAEAAASLYLDVIETLLGRGDGTAARQALTIWRELGDSWQEARTHNQLGIRAYYAGRWDEALGHYQRARDAAGRAGGVWMAAAGAINIAEILSDQGRLVEAQPLLTDALAVWRASGAPTSIAFARSYLGRVAARAGRHDEAMAYYAQAREGFVGDGEHAEVLETDARIAECLVLQGRSAAALEAADVAIQRAAGLAGSGAQLPLLHRVRGLALAQLGDLGRSRAALVESLRIARSRDALHEVAWTLDALIQTTAGDAEPDWVRERDALVERLGMVHVTRAPLPSVVIDLTTVVQRDGQQVAQPT